MMLRILIFIAIMVALIVALVIVTTPHLLLLALVMAILSLLVRWAWGVAGNFTRRDPEDGT